MRRRDLLVCTGAARAAAFPAPSQGLPRIGYLVAGDAEPSWTFFRKGMENFGYVDGRRSWPAPTR